MQPTNEKIIDFLDQQLTLEENTIIENQINQEKSLAAEFQYLKLAVDTVRRDAINDKVFAIRHSIEKTRSANNNASGTPVRTMFKTSLRVAAVFLLCMGITILYKYISVSNKSVYEKQFTAYELGNTRGVETRNTLSEAYQNKNWNEVIAVFNAEKNNSNKSIFLAAMAEMQLNHFPKAVILFENLLNSKSGDDSFREEATYYLSLAYLMNHQENKGLQLLNNMKADTAHTYYPLVSKLSAIDLKIIELKNK